ncbi:MAG: hypothetical protein CMK32_01480 [Porticoccaceae bacterium]|nr:hypothetical protein [Porticoccaceae bacterium]
MTGDAGDDILLDRAAFFDLCLIEKQLDATVKVVELTRLGKVGPTSRMLRGMPHCSRNREP